MTFIAPIKFAIDLLAVLLLALGIKGLSKVRSAREANRLAAIAMALAVFGVLLKYQNVAQNVFDDQFSLKMLIAKAQSAEKSL